MSSRAENAPLKENDYLKGIRIFLGLSDAERSRITELFKARKVAKNEMILMAEEAGSTFYVIIKGSFKISMISREGREMILSTLTEGAFFGEMSLLDGKKRSANVTALEQGELMALRRKDFLGILEEMPHIAIKIMEELAKRMRRADQQIKSLALLDVLGRVAGTIIRLGEDRGVARDEGIEILNRPSHQALANMAGTSRETVTRVLGDLRNQGFIEMDEKRLFIRNEKQMDENFVL